MGKIHAVLVNLPDSESRGKEVLPPVHLLTLASFFPEDYSLDLIDLNVERLSWKRLIGASFVYVSVPESGKALFAQLVSVCNRLGIPVAAGGELIDGDERARVGVAFVILKEGVTTVADFADDFIRGTPRPLYRPGHAQNMEGVRGPRYELIAGRRYPTRGRSIPDLARELLKGFGNQLNPQADSL